MLKEEINIRALIAINEISIGRTKASIAQVFDIKPSKMSEILNGRMMAGSDILSILCTQFRISPNWLFSGKEPMFTPQPIELLANRFSKIVQLLELDASAAAFHVSTLELANFTNNMVLPERPLDYANFMAEFPEFNYEWLMTGVGPMCKSLEAEKAAGFRARYPSQAPALAKPAEPCSKDAIPLIPYDAIAGYGSFDFQELPIEDYYSVADLKGADFLIRVKGDSMSPKYSGGDIVACKKIEMITFWQWHKIYAICTRNQGILIKRVEEYPNNPAFISCRSENPAYRPFEIHEDEIISAALVLGAIVLE